MNRWVNNQAKRIFLASLKDLQGGYLEVVCPDATYTLGDPKAPLKAMAVIHDERFFVRAVSAADVGVGESFMDGDWTTPDLVSLAGYPQSAPP
jgi:cyclopropane-fatty-acyl-phospholipid synthase